MASLGKLECVVSTVSVNLWDVYAVAALLGVAQRTGTIAEHVGRVCWIADTLVAASEKRHGQKETGQAPPPIHSC
jgi:hypothetical protein